VLCGYKNCTSVFFLFLFIVRGIYIVLILMKRAKIYSYRGQLANYKRIYYYILYFNQQFCFQD